MTDYELVQDLTGKSGEEALNSMISDATYSNEQDLFKSTFSTTDISKECNQIENANQLKYFLKIFNLLEKNNNLSQSTVNNGLAILFNGKNKKGESYSQIRWTKKGKEYILKNINQDELQDYVHINGLELKYTKQNNKNIYIIICIIENENNFYYELNQKIENLDIANQTILKIKDKGNIDLQYWTIKKRTYYNNYCSDFESHNLYCWGNNFRDDQLDCWEDEGNSYDESNPRDIKRMINDVSDILGYQVDENLAKSYIYDISR